MELLSLDAFARHYDCHRLCLMLLTSPLTLSLPLSLHSLEMHKNLTLDPTSTPTSTTTLTSTPAMPIQLPKLLAPSPLMGMGMGLGTFDSMLGQHRGLTTKIKGGLVMQAAATGMHGGATKFTPY